MEGVVVGMSGEDNGEVTVVVGMVGRGLVVVAVVVVSWSVCWIV